MQYSLTFPSGTVKYVFQSHFGELKQLINPANSILLIDSEVSALHAGLFEEYRKIEIKAEEEYKSLEQVAEIAKQLLKLEAHRKTTLIGIGGGITTDITGLIAATYMRGIDFGFVPTTLLCMADAAIGGKNGVNLGLQKNLLGTIQQPSFIFYDAAFLQTLPSEEWSNGFAEVIKYACLFDAALFEELSEHDIKYYQDDKEALNLLIERCADWKNEVVIGDEKETANRKLLNFGHTAGHAIETLYQLPHGYAVAIGMMIACKVSEKETGLNSSVKNRLQKLLQQYRLPVSIKMNTEQVMEVMRMDKKRYTDTIDYILLEDIGKPVIKELPFSAIKEAIENYNYAGSS